MLQEFSTWQFLVAICFIFLLVFFQFWIKKNKSSIRKKFHKNKRVNIIEVTKTGINDNVQILKIDNNEFVIFQSKGATPFVMELNSSNLKNKQIQNKIIKDRDENAIDLENNVNHPKKNEKKMMRAISIARKLNPKVNF